MKTTNLTAEIMKDDDALALAVEKLFLGSKKFRKASRKVRRAQHRLQRHLGRKGRAEFMRLEETVNARAADETDLLVRWAWEAGERHGVALGVRLVTT